VPILAPIQRAVEESQREHTGLVARPCLPSRPLLESNRNASSREVLPQSREVQNPPMCSSKTACPLVDEKEDAKGFYLGRKTLELKNGQSFTYAHGSKHYMWCEGPDLNRNSNHLIDMASSNHDHF